MIPIFLHLLAAILGPSVVGGGDFPISKRIDSEYNDTIYGVYIYIYSVSIERVIPKDQSRAMLCMIVVATTVVGYICVVCFGVSERER